MAVADSCGVTKILTAKRKQSSVVIFSVTHKCCCLKRALKEKSSLNHSIALLFELTSDVGKKKLWIRYSACVVSNFSGSFSPKTF